MQRIVTIPTAGVSNAMAAYTIGFVKLEVHNNVEDAIGSGSGTLVSVGKVRGILTAAHVLDNLPDRGTVGIVEYRGESIHYRKRTIEMADTTKILLHGDAFGPDGPDLGFLRLAGETVGWFEAIGSFYNLLKHRSDVSQPAPSQHSTDAIVGMIDERTKDLPAERPLERRKGFEALFSNGTISAEREVGGYDLFDFAPTDYPDFKLPGDYRGTSGGAVWRIYLQVNGEKPEIAGARLWGVPYYQTKKYGGGHTLTCHGMGGVYGALLDTVIAKWPEETSET
jgi:hypothetical protein